MAPASTRTPKSARFVPFALCLLLTGGAAAAAVVASVSKDSTPTHQLDSAAIVAKGAAPAPVTTTTSSSPTSSTIPPPATTAPVSTTTVAPTTSTSTSTTTTVPPAAAPGFLAGHVTAVGDSVMLDYQDPLETDIPGIDVDAAVSRQWGDGETILQQLKSAGQLGSEVIVALSTNGPIADTDFDNMMAILSGANRVVFVNVHVDKPWQDPNNAVIAAGATRYPNVSVADWATLAAQNPDWFGPDGTHLAIDGPGADALANLITYTLNNG
jgi:hypothetical protein